MEAFAAPRRVPSAARAAVRAAPSAARAGLGLAWRAFRRFEEHEGWVLAGFIAYSGLLAIFPFLIFLSSLAAVTVGPEQVDQSMALLFDLAPPDVAQALEPMLRQTLSRPPEGMLTIAALGALWASSNGVEAFRTAFDRAYEAERPRAFALRRAIGIAAVIAGAAASFVLGFAVVLAPLLLTLAEQWFGVSAPFGLGLVRYAIALGALAVLLYLMHWALPSRALRGAPRWPGIATSMAVWIAAASAFSLFLGYAPSFSVTYGGLAGVIVTLLFFYLSGAVIIFGAELNAELHRGRRDAAAKAAAAQRRSPQWQ